MIDMFKINHFTKFYMDQYPEIRIYVSYDPYLEIVKWEFDAHNFSINTYESYTGSCVAYDTDYVLSKLDDSFLYFLQSDGVKMILLHYRTEEL